MEEKLYQKICDILSFLKSKFSAPIQAFDTESQCGDSKTVIYQKDGITILYCEEYRYIEVLGFDIFDFDSLLRLSDQFLFYDSIL